MSVSRDVVFVSRIAHLALGLAAMLAWVGIAVAQPIDVALFSPDVSVTLGSVHFDDEDVAFEDFSTPISPFVPIPLPVAVDLSAFHYAFAGSGTLYFTTDVTAELAGPLTVSPRDIVALDFAGTYSIALDGSSLGVPAGTRIDALSQDPLSSLLVVSFDTSVALGGQTFADEDLVLMTTPPSLYLDGSAAGVPAALDVDGASVFEGDLTVLSFDGSGVVGGVAFDDEDLLLYWKAADAWAMAYDASAAAPGMAGGPDTNATFVPEPTAPLLWLAGLAWLGCLDRISTRRRRRAVSKPEIGDVPMAPSRTTRWIAARPRSGRRNRRRTRGPRHGQAGEYQRSAHQETIDLGDRGASFA